MAKERRNFKDPVTGEKFFIPTHSTSFDSAGNKVYRDKYRKELVNEKTGNKLVSIPRKTDYSKGMPMVSKFNATSPEGQANIKKHFGSRANKFDTQGAGRDERDARVQDFKDGMGIKKKHRYK